VHYNFAAGTFLSKKLCGRLHSIEVDFYSKKGKVRFLSHPLGVSVGLDVSATTATITSSKWRRNGCTWQTHVADVQEFVITTWIVKECRVDGQRTSCMAATQRVQWMLDVYFTFTIIRNSATHSTELVISPVSCLFEHEQIISACTRQFENGVETGVATSQRWLIYYNIQFAPVGSTVNSQNLRPLDLSNQKWLLWIGSPRKPPVISNHILVISPRNAYITIFVPKLVAMVAPLCPLCTGEFPDSTNSISKPNTAWMCCIQLKLWQFCAFSFFPYFGQNLVAMARPLEPKILSIAVTQAKLCRFEGSIRDKFSITGNREFSVF